MLVGHIGVVTFGMALLGTDEDDNDEQDEKPAEREDVAIYRAYGFPGVLLKLLKVGWKVPQFLVKQS